MCAVSPFRLCWVLALVTSSPAAPLRAANFTAPMTNPVGISNDIMAAAPGDAYLGYAVRRLRHWNRWMGIKYIQASSAAGRRPARGCRRVGVLLICVAVSG